MNGDSGVQRSSIALLQERFRKLQRVKEMREEKELLRQLNRAEYPNQLACYNTQFAPVSHPDLILPWAHPQGSQTLQSNSQSMHSNFLDAKSPLSTKTLWTDQAVRQHTENFDTDVDTSLHL